MAVVVSIARGHDASYPFRTIGADEGTTVTGERGAGYYLSAVEKGGEPAGFWIGNGAADLGFPDGDTVRREDFGPLYGQFLDPRDPSGQTYLGSPHFARSTSVRPSLPGQRVAVGGSAMRPARGGGDRAAKRAMTGARAVTGTSGSPSTRCAPN